MNSIALLTASGTEPASALSLVVSMLPLVLVIVIMYFMLIRPQKKKEKETAAGGIVGRVVSLREDTLLIETGSNNTKIRIKRWAIQSCETIHDDV